MEQTSNNPHNEILEFVLSTLWLGVAFGLAIAGGVQAFSDIGGLKTIILQSIIVVFFAFALHEIAHRVIARHFGYRAAFHMWLPGLVIALVSSLLGFIFAAPGAVYISGGDGVTVEKTKLGKSALAGPLMNLLLSLIFAGALLGMISLVQSTAISDSTYLRLEPAFDFTYGTLLIATEINAWMAIFNLLPVASFDGYKVFAWNRKVWGITFGLSILLYAAIFWAQRHLF